MSTFKRLLDNLTSLVRATDNPVLLDAISGLIDYGQQRKDGGHDHRYNRGPDRTEAQRKADQRRRKH
nr:hypothetical protein [Pseudomonas oleovorans]